MLLFLSTSVAGVGPIRLIIKRKLAQAVEKPVGIILTDPRSWRWKIIKLQNFDENFVEISTGARKRGKNGNLQEFKLKSSKFGSTGRQNAQESGFRSFTPFLISNYEGLSKYGVWGTGSEITSIPNFQYLTQNLKKKCKFQENSEFQNWDFKSNYLSNSDKK